MNKTTFLTLAAIAFIALAFFLVRGNSNEDGGYVVKLASMPILPSKLPIEIAKQKGFFEEEGVEVEVIELQSSNLATEAVLRGDADAAPGISTLPTLQAEVIDPGNIRIFAVQDATSDKPFDSILIDENSMLEKLEDLAGKKIGVFPGTTATNILKKFLQDRGVNVSSTTFVPIPAGEQLGALAAGSIDALFAYEPTVSIGLSEAGAKRMFGSVFAGLLEHSPNGAYLLNARFVSEHPREAESVVKALTRAIDLIKEDEVGTRAIAADVFGFKPGVVESLALPYFRHSEKIDRPLIDAYMDILIEVGELSGKPDLSDIIYTVQ